MTSGGFLPSARERALRLAQTMAAERACERLVVGYAHAVDFGRIDAAVAMFSPTATFEVMGTTFSGREEIAAGLRRLAETHPVTRHAISSVATHPREDGTGDGISYVTLYGAAPEPLLVGHFRDRFEVSDEAGWMIAQRRLDATYVASDLDWP